MDIIPFRHRPLNAPGIYSDVGMDVYHGQLTATPSASRSVLHTIFEDSPAHAYLKLYLNPNREEDDPSEAMILGQAAHHLILGQRYFEEHFVVRPDKFDSWRTKEAKAWRAEKQVEGLQVIEPKHTEAIDGMAASLAQNALVRNGALGGLIEHTMICLDEETGIWLKVRPDSLPNDSADVTDLKTAASVTDEWIEKAIGDTGINMQAAMIARAFKQILGMEMQSFSTVFVETKPPYCCRVRTLKPADIELGDRQVAASLRLMKRCLDEDHWPGPGGDQRDAEFVEMPPWQRSKIERKLQMMEAEAAI
jgi:hypothetical protein